MGVEREVATYLLQEIVSEKDQRYLVGITSGDGLTVALNGTILAEHNNPFKEKMLKDVILLQLKKGRNQLVVKFYNGYQKNMSIGIDNKVAQVMYAKKLKPLQFETGKYYPFSWQLHKPLSPHTTLGLFNASILLKK